MTPRTLAAAAVLALALPVARADDLTDNAKACAAAAADAYESTFKRLVEAAPDSAAGVDPLYQWSLRWMTAEQDASDKKEDRIAAAEAHLERMKKVEDRVKTMHRVGILFMKDEQAAKFYRLEAERQVLLAKAAK